METKNEETKENDAKIIQKIRKRIGICKECNKKKWNNGEKRKVVQSGEKKNIEK